MNDEHTERAKQFAAKHVIVLRARYYALVAAAEVLPKMLFDFADDDTRREAYAAIAALRAAGIILKDKP